MPFRQRLLWVCVAIAVLGIGLGFGLHLAERWDLSPGGSPKLFGLIGVPIFVLMFFSFGAAILGLPLLVFESRRANAAYLSLGGFLLVGSFTVTHALLPDVRTPAFGRLGERLMPVVKAIENYREDNEVYPESLDQLVPEYLEELPETGLGNYKEYLYTTGDWANDFEGNPWVLSVHSGGFLGFGFDRFMYLPLQNYPTENYHDGVAILGKWAYVYE